MPRYKLTIAYDGTRYHGWQAQRPPDAHPLRTVQDTIREAIIQAVKHPLEITGASRTDTGVHALGQVAHVDLETRIPDERIHLAINARLPEDIEIRRAERVPDSFHALRNVESKQYRYRIWCSPHRPLHHRFHVHYCWWHLDLARMQAATNLLEGRHDFEGFSTAGHGRATTVRTIHHCEIAEVAGDTPELHLVIRGDGFLYNMVRIIAGTLIEVGRGRMSLERVSEVLETANRQLAGPTLTPQGLWLEWIRYRDLETEPSS